MSNEASKTPNRYPDPADQKEYEAKYLLGRAWGRLLGSEIEREEAQKQALTDSLTGLPNLRAMELFYHFLRGQLSRNASEKACILFGDLDHFKKVNDTFGHDMGNAVLRKTAQVMLQNLREGDVVGRTGGEEFVVMLPYTGLELGATVAERLRKGVESIHAIDGKIVDPTISIGVAEVDIEHENFAAAALPADLAMYRAKNLGRNQVHVAGQPEETFSPTAS